MACLLATDSPSGARGGSAPVDRAPARPSPGPEPPAPPPAPPAGTWQKRPVKSGGHRHWFREEHWPPFIQGRGHTTGEERWVDWLFIIPGRKGGERGKSLPFLAPSKWSNCFRKGNCFSVHSDGRSYLCITA